MARHRQWKNLTAGERQRVLTFASGHGAEAASKKFNLHPMAINGALGGIVRRAAKSRKAADTARPAIPHVLQATRANPLPTTLIATCIENPAYVKTRRAGITVHLQSDGGVVIE